MMEPIGAVDNWGSTYEAYLEQSRNLSTLATSVSGLRTDAWTVCIEGVNAGGEIKD